MNRNVYVTGIGAVSAAGDSIDALWASLLHPTAPPDYKPAPVDYSATVPARLLRRSAPAALMALHATTFAIADALIDLHDLTSDRAGVWISCCAPGTSSPGSPVSSTSLTAEMTNGPAAVISTTFGVRGPVGGTSTACAGGADAVLYATYLIRSGICDIVVAGAFDAPSERVAQGFEAVRARAVDRQLRPFDRQRSGTVTAHGGAAIILESAERVTQRDARPYAVIRGGAATSDGYHMTRPRPGGAEQAMQRALRASATKACEVVSVNAHGTGTVLNDTAEACGIATLFPHEPPVTAIKGITGHALGGSSALENAVAALSIFNQCAPPTPNHHELDPNCPIDVVTTIGRSLTAGPIVSNSFAFGGHNTVIVYDHP
jgi:3-oxoacyl-[acyl-carrier-protein] synthase II